MSLLLKGIKLLAQNLINRLFLGSCQQFSCALPNATPCKRTRSQFLIRRYEFLKLHDHWPHYRIGTFQSKSRVHLSWQGSKKLKSSFTWKRQPPVHLADDDASFERIGKCRREQTLHSEGEKYWKLSSELSIFVSSRLLPRKKCVASKKWSYFGRPMSERRQKTILWCSSTSIKVLIRRGTWKIDKSQNKINPHLVSRRGNSILDHERSRSTCVPWKWLSAERQKDFHPRVVRKNNLSLILWGFITRSSNFHIWTHVEVVEIC